jgi:hypothetical protein
MLPFFVNCFILDIYGIFSLDVLKEWEHNFFMMKVILKPALWLSLVMIIALLFIGASCSCDNSNQTTENGTETKNEKGEPPRSFTDEELAAANLALENGIKIEDPENDFFKFPPNHYQPDGRLDNDNPYPLSFTDLRSVTIGADDTYLYVKYQFWGEFPTSSVIYNGDLLWSTGAKITQFTFINAEGKEDSAELGSGVNLSGYENNQHVATDQITIGQLAMISPIGHDEHMEVIYKTMNGAGMVAGGPGEDYILSAFPLSLFGIHSGDTVTFSCATETGSDNYHHECIDDLLGREGYLGGSTISYVLGENKYQIVETPTDIVK